MGLFHKLKLEKTNNGEEVTIVLNSEKKGKRIFSNKDSFKTTIIKILGGRR